ncbi:MFS transporter [Priestia megaterium]|uniref:MFS transporter n=1 Tax=Priestia megaterium TaxID=1404 RepID=UPI0032423843
MNSSKPSLIIFSILTGTFLIPVNSTMIAVGLPSIAKALHLSIVHVSVVVTIYLIVMAVAQPIAGKLGDLYGNKTMFVAGMIIFLVGSAACVFSYNLLALTVFRTLQALGGALATPNATAIMRHSLPKEKLGRTLGLFGLSMGLGAAVGPVLGAFLIKYLGWTSIFWFNVPFAVLSLICSFIYVPSNVKQKAKMLDIGGAFLLGVSMTSFTLMLTHRDLFNAWTIFICIASIVLFIVQERKVQEPLIDFKLFKVRPFFSSNLSILCSNFMMYSTILFVPLLLEKQYDIRLIGLLLFFFSLAMSISSWLGGLLAEKVGKEHPIRLSFLISLLAAMLYFHLANASISYTIVSLLVGGVGAGIGVSSMQAMNIQSVKKEQSGTASGIYSTFRYIGGMLASAAVSLLVGTTGLLVVLCIAGIAGFLVSLVGKEKEKQVSLSKDVFK